MGLIQLNLQIVRWNTGIAEARHGKGSGGS